MHKKPNPKPRLVRLEDTHGNEFALPRLAQELVDADRAAVRDAIRATSGRTVQEDLQATRRLPLDAPMATRDEDAWADKTDYRLDTVLQPSNTGRAILVVMAMASSFIAGVVVGRLA